LRPRLLLTQSLDRKFAHLRFPVRLDLNTERRGRTPDEIDTSDPRAVRGCSCGVANTARARLFLVCLPLLVQRLRIFGDLALLGLVETDQAEIVLTELSINAAGDT